MTPNNATSVMQVYELIREPDESTEEWMYALDQILDESSLYQKAWRSFANGQFQTAADQWQLHVTADPTDACARRLLVLAERMAAAGCLSYKRQIGALGECGEGVPPSGRSSASPPPADGHSSASSPQSQGVLRGDDSPPTRPATVL